MIRLFFGACWFGSWAVLSAAPPVNVRDFGAVGDAMTDDTTAIERAFAVSNQVYFPSGVYVLTDGIDLPENAVLTGDGAPSLGVFPRGGDDKRCFAPGKRAELPGTTLLFRGTGERSLTTGRTDDFAEVRYAIRTAPVYDFRIEQLAIALDLDVYDTKGKLTTPKNDARSDFDVGLLIDDSAAGTVRDVAVFGFWKKAGMLLLSRGLGDNPDYNTFWNSSFMGEYGVALLGLDSGESPGLSGTQFYGCRLFANDHHTRGAGQWGSAALYIDGDTPAKRAELNGHYFFGGCIRTYSNVAVKLDHASNVSFNGVVFEVPRFDGKRNEGADRTGRIVGTKDTRDVYLFGCRKHDIGLTELGKGMTDGVLVAFPDDLDGMSIHKAGRVARLSPGLNSGPGVQLTTDGSSSATGWSMRGGDDGALVFRHQNEIRGNLTAAGTWQSRKTESHFVTAEDLSVGAAIPARVVDGAVKVRGSRMILSAEEGSALTDLEGGREGQLLILEQAPDSGEIRIWGEQGSVTLGSPFSFETPYSRLTLLRTGDAWVELSRVK